MLQKGSSCSKKKSYCTWIKGRNKCTRISLFAVVLNVFKEKATSTNYIETGGVVWWWGYIRWLRESNMKNIHIHTQYIRVYICVYICTQYIHVYICVYICIQYNHVYHLWHHIISTRCIQEPVMSWHFLLPSWSRCSKNSSGNLVKSWLVKSR